MIALGSWLIAIWLIIESIQDAYWEKHDRKEV